MADYAILTHKSQLYVSKAAYGAIIRKKTLSLASHAVIRPYYVPALSATLLPLPSPALHTLPTLSAVPALPALPPTCQELTRICDLHLEYTSKV